MPRLSGASEYLSGGSEVHPIPLFLLTEKNKLHTLPALRLRPGWSGEKRHRSKANAGRLKTASWKISEAGNGSDQQGAMPPINFGPKSHPGCTCSSSLRQYWEKRNHKSKGIFPVTKNPVGQKNSGRASRNYEIQKPQQPDLSEQESTKKEVRKT